MAAHPRANESFGFNELLYCNGVLKSTRYPHASTDAAGAKTLLSDNFPEYNSLVSKYNHNVIGSGNAWREPYGTSGTMITLYVTEQPEDSVKTQWGVDTNLDCCPWYGYKFMMSPNEVKLKVPFWDPDGYYDQPEFPVEVYHYSNVYHADGTLWNKREAFMHLGGRMTITKYCEDHGLNVPWGSMTDLKFKQWSVVYDSTTLVPEMVKCYVYE